MLPPPGVRHLHLNSVDPDAAIDTRLATRARRWSRGRAAKRWSWSRSP